MKFDKPDLQEDFIFNVKPRRYATEPTPITTALGIGRRIQYKDLEYEKTQLPRNYTR